MKVAIITAKNGTPEVHAAGCADVAKSAKRNHDDAWVFEADSLVDVSGAYWGDVITDEHPAGSPEHAATVRDYASSQFNVLPCAKELPFDAEAEATPAATVSTWVGKAIASHVINCKTGSVAAKLEAAKPTKAGDRTVKLTAEEATELRAICTELEGVSGYGYSARTLRARLS